LKDSVPGTDIVEAEFDNPPADWNASLEKLDGVTSVKSSDGVTRIASASGPLTVGEVMNLARDNRVNVRRVSVQGTTLDDVFLYYTGRQLRDAASETMHRDIQPFVQVEGNFGHMKLQRIFAIIERDMRKFFPQSGADDEFDDFPAHAAHRAGLRIRRKNQGNQIAVVDEDRTAQSRDIRQRFDAIVAGPQTMKIENYSSISDAEIDLRAGFVRAVVYIPVDFSQARGSGKPAAHRIHRGQYGQLRHQRSPYANAIARSGHQPGIESIPAGTAADGANARVSIRLSICKLSSFIPTSNTSSTCFPARLRCPFLSWP
jgi:hypothetical protein